MTRPPSLWGPGPRGWPECLSSTPSFPALRAARLWARVRLLWTDRHPRALKVAAQVFLASRRYQQALDFAEEAFERVRLGETGLESARAQELAMGAAIVATLACAGLRNQTADETQRILLADNALHWGSQLAKMSLVVFREEVLPSAMLRDLRSHMQEIADAAEAENQSQDLRCATMGARAAATETCRSAP